ncbi:hypothetical protein P3S68_023536 [Capsicum galapagoense]
MHNEVVALVYLDFGGRLLRICTSILPLMLKGMINNKKVSESLWPLYQRHWNSPEYQLLSEKGKRVRTSSKGGFLYTAGARSTLAVKEKLGRELPTDEIFEATHLRKKTNPTNEDVWVEPRAKVVYDEFRRLLGEYCSNLPPETSGLANRSHFYGCHTEYFGDNIRCLSDPAYSSSSVDAETIVRLQNTISQLIEELAEQRKRYVEQSARQKKTEEATTSQIRMLQQQISSFIQTRGVIPPCPGDAVRAAKGLGPLDDFSMDDDMENEDEFDDDGC